MINLAVQPDESLENDNDDIEGSPIGIPIDRKPVRTSKPRTAGILLIVAFAFILFTIINTSIGTYQMLNSNGVTSVEGIVEDGDGNPVEEVIVTVEGTDIVTATDEKGRYSISQVSAGDNTLKFYKPGYRVLIVRTFLYSKDALDQNGLKTNEIDIPSYLPGGAYTRYLKGPFVKVQKNELINCTVSGTVIAEDGTPMPNVNISVTDTKIFAITDAAGYFRLENVTTGIHEFRAINGTGSGSQFISLITLIPPDENFSIGFMFNQDDLNQVFDFTEGKTGMISGRVVDDQPEAAPIVNAEVWLEPAELNDNFTYRVLTNDNGEFELTAIPIGIYNITASAENYDMNITSNLVVDNYSNITQNIQLTKLDSPFKSKADLDVFYYCVSGLVIIAIIAILGGISAYRRKRYGLAFAAAILCISPSILWYTDSLICGAAVISVVALLLIVLAKNEFEPPRIE